MWTRARKARQRYEVASNISHQEFYQPRGVRYLGLKMFDVPQTNISKYFDEASDFIEEAISSEGNKRKPSVEA